MLAASRGALVEVVGNRYELVAVIPGNDDQCGHRAIAGLESNGIGEASGEVMVIATAILILDGHCAAFGVDRQDVERPPARYSHLGGFERQRTEPEILGKPVEPFGEPRVKSAVGDH